jgi:predicted adenylyl cyclase CyaB
MPINLELKVKLKSFGRIKKILKEINAEYIGVLKQTDIYYKTTRGLLKLRIENGNSTLIKYLRDEISKNRFSNYEILKFCSGNASNFFENIFKIEAVVTKRRQLYMFDNTRIHLDMVKELGYFLELETIMLNGKTDAKKRFNFMLSALELDKHTPIRKSYRDLMSES